jgi:hypothetical protein
MARAAAARAMAFILSLERILMAFNARRRRHDPHIWEVGGNVIEIDDRQFVDSAVGVRGQGAIALVIHLAGCTYDTALTFLAQRFSADEALSAAAERRVLYLTPKVIEAAQTRVDEPLPLARPYAPLAPVVARRIVEQIAPARGAHVVPEQPQAQPTRPPVEPSRSVPAPLAQPSQEWQRPRADSRPAEEEERRDQAGRSVPKPVSPQPPNAKAEPGKDERAQRQRGDGGRSGRG